MSKITFSPPEPPSSSPPPLVSAAIVSIMSHYKVLVSLWNVMSAFACIPKISGGS